ncbi:MAG TPA: ABC transporter ATP-binding protein, partial [Chloroflexota bacterium]
MSQLLRIEDLSVAYNGRPAVSDLSFTIERHEAFGLVGESGSGKTTVALSLMRYLPAGGRSEGRIMFDGQDVLSLDAASLRAFRGRRVAMVYQNPAAALNPSMVVGDQVLEVFGAHAGLNGLEGRQRVRDILAQVRLPDPETIYHRYPHELSGGMQQRVVIAMALAARPDLLVLDEPTTGLDATVEAAVLDLVEDVRRELDMSLLLISHNLGVIRRVCDRVGVMYAGRLVEQGPATDVFAAPAHPYTRGLLASLPRWGASKRTAPLRAIPGQAASASTAEAGCTFAPRCSFAREVCYAAEPPLVSITGNPRASRCYFADEVLASPLPAPAPSSADHAERLEPELMTAVEVRKTYHPAGGRVVALDGLSIGVPRAATVGLVGESGSGKSTMARVITGLDPLDSGDLEWKGAPLEPRVQRRARGFLRHLQMVFQDPDSTLNPRHTVRTLLDRSIRRLGGLDTRARRARAIDLLRAVDLDTQYLEALPSELSGGQRQRVAIARAFAGEPDLVVCDEPTSALDASVQATILNLLDRLQRERGTAYLFISHD